MVLYAQLVHDLLHLLSAAQDGTLEPLRLESFGDEVGHHDPVAQPDHDPHDDADLVKVQSRSLEALSCMGGWWSEENVVRGGGEVVGCRC